MDECDFSQLFVSFFEFFERRKGRKEKGVQPATRRDKNKRIRGSKPMKKGR
jgi:hypothetical protein